MAFVELDIPTTEEELLDRVFDALEERFPGYDANDAHLDSALAQELARMVLEAIGVAANVSQEIFRQFGKKLIGLAPIEGSASTALTTWTAIDDAGYVIPAATVVAYRQTGDVLTLFETVVEVEILPTTTQVSDVEIQATEVGDEPNGLPVGTEFELVDALSFISSIVSTTATAGGVDAETEDEYVGRLVDYLTLLTPAPILPEDFALLARNVIGVHRATAIDGYDPADQSVDNERMVAVAAVDADGVAVSAQVKTAVDDYLQDLREATFEVNVIDPTYTNVDIVFTVQVTPGSDPAVVEAAAEQAVTDYIDPANWAGGDESPPRWRNEPVVRYLEVATVIENVAGVERITVTAGDFDLTINGGRVDVLLGGVAPLPQTIAGGSSVDGTAVAP